MSTEHKIIFAGPVQVGKTTAIASVSDIPVVSTNNATAHVNLDLNLSLDLDLRGGNAAVAIMDYGMMQLEGNERIHLLAIPSEARFDFLWDSLTKGAIGLILLVDNSSEDPFKDLHFFLGAFESFVAERRVVIGVTRMDEHPLPTLDTYYDQIEAVGARLPVFELDPRRHADVQAALRALLYSLDPGLVNE